MIGIDRTTTTSVLLAALHDPANQTVWEAFDARFRPILTAVAQHLGLNREDGAEVAQQTLVEFARDYRAGKYDRSRGRLSSWIIGIARHRVIDMQRRKGRRGEWRGESALANLADEQQLTQIWEAEQQRAIFNEALAELREKTRTSETTLHVFEQVALEGVPPETVSAESGLTVAEVYRVKNRITKRLREIVARITEVYEEAG
jgi:RNA polymerase sigma factor (sigma-70 family)